MMSILRLRKGTDPLPVFRPEASLNIKIKDARIGGDTTVAVGYAQTEVLGLPGAQRKQQVDELTTIDHALCHRPAGSVQHLQDEGAAVHPRARLQFQAQNV